MKKLHVRVTPNSRQDGIREQDGILIVKVSAKAEAGKANQAVLDLLAEYFHISKNDIRILSGAKSRKKIIGIPE